jgi:dihydroorotate dehydrogenase
MKRDLVFSKPLMNAAGILGFAPDPHTEIPWDTFGAFVTNPISLRPRMPTSHPDLIEYPGGFLLHTGLPNPGLAAVIKKYNPRWSRTDLPIIVHLIADRPEESQRMVQMVEGLDNIMAAELGFAPLLADDLIMLTLDMCRGELPLIISLSNEQVLSLGPRLLQAGASAISLSAPRGSLSRIRYQAVDGQMGSELVSGRLYGPSLFPAALETVHNAAKLGLPVIGAGGVWTSENVEAMLSAGAMGVQKDAVLWILKQKKNKNTSA